MKTIPRLFERRARNRAVSLIEGVLYLVVALAVIAAGIVYFQQATLARQVNETSKMMTSVSAYLVDRLKTASSTAADPEFGWDESPTFFALSSDSVPTNMIDADGIIRHPWGGVITFYEQYADFNGESTPLLVARMNDVPESVCIRLGQKNLGGDTMVGLDVLQIDIEENYMVSTDNELFDGDVLYSVGPNEETDFQQLATVCQDGVDIVIYYLVTMVPDNIPQLGTGPYGSSGGGFGGGGGGGGAMMCYDPLFEAMVPCGPEGEMCLNSDGYLEDC